MSAGRSGKADDQRTVLIVDDHDHFRATARRMLAREGFDVVGEAADGASAINAVRLLCPDIVLLDVVLPDIDGFAVCIAITGGDDPPVIVLTSSRDAASFRARVRGTSARGFIAKSDLTGRVFREMCGLS